YLAQTGRGRHRYEGDTFAGAGTLREPDDLAAGVRGTAAPAVAHRGDALQTGPQVLVRAQFTVVLPDGGDQVLAVPPHLDRRVLVRRVLVDGLQQQLGAAADGIDQRLEVPEPEVSGQDAPDLSDSLRTDFHVEVVVAGHCGLHRRWLLTGEALAPPRPWWDGAPNAKREH